MSKNIIKDKSLEFALKIIKLCQHLYEQKEYVLSKQIMRSGTSIGALIRESEHAESKADFIHKLSIAQKEANETAYWLELLVKSGFIKDVSFSSISDDLSEILKILSSIIITTKKSL
jgi:four helix bundle protein